MRPAGWMAIIGTAWFTAGGTVPVQAASVTVGTLFDTDEGMAWRASGTVAPRRNWLIGAGAGRHEMRFNGADGGVQGEVGYGGVSLTWRGAP